MRTLTVTCDSSKCDSMVTSSKRQTPEGWSEVGMSVGNNFQYGYAGGLYGSSMLLCPDCLKRLGIHKKEQETKEEKDSIQDRLYEIFCEIVEECRQ